MSTIQYHVPNISCGHCVHTIQIELGDLEGVIRVDADEATQNVIVEYQAPATTHAIENLFREINYPAQPVA
jgi:copper chaperone